MARSRVDLPALGSPSRPTSASTRSSGLSRRSSPGRPSVVRRGAWLVLLLKRAFPAPPRPPRAITSGPSTVDMSAMTSPVSASDTIVPAGKVIRQSSPLRPLLLRPAPEAPLPALNLRVKRKSASVFRPTSAMSNTSPPRPPSPPSGPPIGRNFSRRKLRQPWPPLPACTEMTASSTNFMVFPHGSRAGALPAWQKKPRLQSGVFPGTVKSLLGDHAHHLAAARALDLELDAAVGEREQREVTAHADVHAGVERAAALAHDDVARRHLLAAEALDAEPLGLGIAAVA